MSYLDDHIIICAPGKVETAHWRIRDANGCTLAEWPEATEAYVRGAWKQYKEEGIPSEICKQGPDYWQVVDSYHPEWGA